jgi:hypothetical protein
MTARSKIWTTIEELRRGPEYEWFERTRGIQCPDGVMLIVERVDDDQPLVLTSGFAPGVTVAELHASAAAETESGEPVSAPDEEADAEEAYEFRCLVKVAADRHPDHGDAIRTAHVAIEIAEQGDWFSATSLMTAVVDHLLWRNHDTTGWQEAWMCADAMREKAEKVRR